MRKAALLIWLISVYFGSFAQNADTVVKLNNLDSLLKQGAVLVVDGKIVTERPPRLYRDSILSINILPHDKTKEIFEGDAKNGIVVIVNKRAAVLTYQAKLGRFSDTYKKYTTSYGDYDIIYILISTTRNIEILTDKDDALTKKLYEIPEGKISEVSFSLKETCCGVNKVCVIGIKDLE